MQRALVKANAQNDEAQVTTKVTQQGQFALPGKERVCPAGKQANPTTQASCWTQTPRRPSAF